jgi:membrane protease YdiL (CAAX protease family)
MRGIWANNTPYSKFLISVGIILLSAILFTIFSSVLATIIYGINMDELQKLMQNPDAPNGMAALKMMQTVSAIGAFIIPSFLLAQLFSTDTYEYLSLNRKPDLPSMVIVILAMLLATPFINFLGELNASMHLPGSLRSVEDWMKNAEDQAAKLTQAFLKMDTFGDFLFNLVMIGLLPAIGEELVFRGIVQKLFVQLAKNVHVGVWLSAILFSAIHMQFYGFLPRMVLGLMLGYMLVWSGSLWLPIIGHFINNAGAVLFMYLFQHGYTDMDPDKIGTQNDFAGVAISIVLTVLLFVILHRRNRNRSEVIV